MNNLQGIYINKIKDQFARFLRQDDWLTFKTMAEYYLRSSATLRKKDIKAPSGLRLWIRNSTKRLYIGIGCELLLKSFYLKEGYCINNPKKQKNKVIKGVPTHKFDAIDSDNFDCRNTYTFGPLINNLKAIHKFMNQTIIQKSFDIAMVFRNKEGHAAFLSHNFDSQNYTDIEKGIESFYQEAFDEKLSFRIAMKPNEVGRFEINSTVQL